MNSLFSLCVMQLSVQIGYCGKSHSSSSDDSDNAAFLAVPIDGFGSESVEYDSTNELLFFADFQSIPTTIYASPYDGRAIRDGEDFMVSTDMALSNGDHFVALPTAMYADGVHLYVNSLFSGEIIRYDIATFAATGAIQVMYDDTTNANLNGMCHDPTNEDIIYVTDIGLNVPTFDGYNGRSALYKVNIAEHTSELVVDFGFDSYPNGCAVSKDGKYVYSITFALLDPVGTRGPLIRINTKDWQWDTYTGITDGGDGLVFDGNGHLFYSAPIDADGNEDGTLYEIKGFESSSLNVYTKAVASGLVTPGDVGYDSDNDWFIIPGGRFDDTGFLYWVENEHGESSSSSSSSSSGSESDSDSGSDC